MDEMTMLRAIRPDAAELTDADRAAARDRLSAEFARPGQRRAARAQIRRASWRPARPSRRRLGLIAVVAAVGAAAAVALVAGPPPARPGPQRATASGPLLAARTASGLTPGQVLLLAARSARSVPDLVIRPGQFLYVAELDRNLSDETNGITRTWTSWDGRHGGLLEQPHSRPQPMPPCPMPAHWQGNPNFTCPLPQPYAANMPDTMSGMLALIRRWNTVWSDDWAYQHGLPGALAESAVTVAVDPEQISGAVLYSNATSALLYAALARLGGLAIVSNAVTVTGRHGIGVATVEQNGYPLVNRGVVGYLVEDVFDPRTYQPIGVDNYTLTGHFLDRAGLLGSGFFGHISRTFTGSAILSEAVVGQPGQLP